ncbi:hypothetical protein C8J36_103256 [Rhizobium sp. PP-F2F-G48]|uniref:hypothetical protein n=1 Tax=Rhizobium sp. PP-F2F-G48 TaxID=2135651 RepID=UPI00104328CA|nr:hypothetical protein [Rhizobium sp. PP-F2F-G48]TCM55890.1 hypothetical protein C8J36_103256 [Rhizobium sp. PP-F2F-G48]
MMPMPSGLFIAGTSHVGKSSLAARLGGSLGWTVISTDDLGRHPGRPWPEVKPQVAEFYTGLSPETAHWFLKVHHENMWPRLLQAIEWQETLEEPFILEGAALRPDYLSTLDLARYRIVFLQAPDAVLRQRVETASDYDHATSERKHLIDRFIERSILDNHALSAGFDALGVPATDADASTIDALAADITARLRQ